MAKTATDEKQKSGNEVSGEKLLTRIKLTNTDTLEIDYKFSNEDEALTVKYEGKDGVTKKFMEQFEETKVIVKEILPTLEEDSKVHIVRLKYDSAGFLDKISLSFQITSLLSNTPINVSTPFIGFVDPDEENQSPALSNNAETMIHEIVALSKAYMNGDTRTKQLSLVVDNEE